MFFSYQYLCCFPLFLLHTTNCKCIQKKIIQSIVNLKMLNCLLGSDMAAICSQVTLSNKFLHSLFSMVLIQCSFGELPPESRFESKSILVWQHQTWHRMTHRLQCGNTTHLFASLFVSFSWLISSVMPVSSDTAHLWPSFTSSSVEPLSFSMLGSSFCSTVSSSALWSKESS